MKKSDYNWAKLFFALQSILIVILLDMKKYHNLFLDIPEWVELSFCVIILCLNFAAVIIVKKLYYSGWKAEQLRITALKYTNLVEKNQIYRQHHHDLKNQLIVVLGYLTQDKYEELRNYLNSYLHTIDVGVQTIETGLDEIDILLSSKLALAKHKEIQIDLTITLILKCRRKHIIDLVAILGNLLDNALEAVQGLEQLQRLVSIRFREDPLDYIFEIENSMPASNPYTPELYFTEGFSTKQTGRGEGLFIVKRLTKRLGGSVSVDSYDGQFSVILEIPKHRLQDTPSSCVT